MRGEVLGLMIQPTGWDRAVHPGDIEQRVLCALRYKLQQIKPMVDVEVLNTAMRLGHPPLDLPTGRTATEIMAYLEVHFSVTIPMEVSETWTTIGDIVRTIQGLGPKGMPEQAGCEVFERDFIVAVDSEGEAWTPFERIHPKRVRSAAASQGRVVISSLAPAELLGHHFTAAGLAHVVEDLEAVEGWRYARVKVLTMRYQESDPTQVTLSDRETAIAAVKALGDLSRLDDPQATIIDELPGSFLRL